jgi:hypothetical protein
MGVIRVFGFRKGNNAVTILLTHLDRVARCVPVNGRRGDAEAPLVYPHAVRSNLFV